MQEAEALLLGKLYGGFQMVSLESIRRGMKTDDDARARWMRDNHQTIYGGASDSDSASGGDDEMGHMVLGDMVTEYHTHQPSEPPEKKSGLLGKLVKYGLAAATGGGIAAAVPFAMDLLTPDAPPAETGETKVIEKNRREGVRVLEPTVIPPGEG